MATHGEIQWPPAGSFGGRLRGESHGRRQASAGSASFAVTGTGMRPPSEAEEDEIIRLLAARGYEVEGTGRSGNTFMVQAKPG
jgi:hypothetical protein